MNLSGQSVRELLSFYKIPTSDLLVIYDDFDLMKGFVRIREKGSAGTHNGMRNIIAETGKEDFPRVRVGFKPDDGRQITLLNYVLSGISAEEKPVYEKALEVASDAGVSFAKGEDIQKIMQKYNGKTN